MEVDSGRYICTHSGYQFPVNVSVYVTVIQPGKLNFKNVYFIPEMFNADSYLLLKKKNNIVKIIIINLQSHFLNKDK